MGGGLPRGALDHGRRCWLAGPNLLFLYVYNFWDGYEMGMASGVEGVYLLHKTTESRDANSGEMLPLPASESPATRSMI